MKKLLALVAGALVAAATFATAFAADLPPRRPATLAPVAPVFTQTGFYVGGHIGYAYRGEQLALGANAGYDFGLVRLEVGYDNFGSNGRTSNLISGNVLLENTYGRFTPYVLAGAGFRFYDDSIKWNDRVGVYIVGAGLRYSLTQSIDLDGRYRFIAPMERNNTLLGRDAEHVTTLGVSYRF